MTDPTTDRLREALLMFLSEYDVDGRQELHSRNCLYRKVWAMGIEDEPQCIAARAALAEAAPAPTPTERLREAVAAVLSEWDQTIADGGLVTVALTDPIEALRDALVVADLSDAHAAEMARRAAPSTSREADL